MNSVRKLIPQFLFRIVRGKRKLRGIESRVYPSLTPAYRDLAVCSRSPALDAKEAPGTHADKFGVIKHRHLFLQVIGAGLDGGEQNSILLLS